MEDIEVSFNPTVEQVDELEQWLIIEFKKKGPVQFYHNWNSIYDSYKEHKMGVILLTNHVVGFVTWYGSGSVNRILFAEIKPGFRKKGYGRMLASALFDKLRIEGVKVLDLHCQPANSEKAWKKLGFNNFPKVEDFEDHNDIEGRYLYQILVPYAAPTKKNDVTETIELWAVEAYRAKRYSPQWKWDLEFENGSRKLKQPIIFPARRSWNIRWKINGEIIKEDQIKYFSDTEIDFNGNLLILEELPLPKNYLIK